jgi:hypothetical protein
MPALLPTNRRWAIVLLFLVSTIVVAQTVERLESSPDYDDLTREVIFEDNIDWRLPPDPEIEWRPEQTPAASNSRFTFGADPSYEKTRTQGNFRQEEFGNDRPTTIFRVAF